ncbi:unnamed protein product [Darwinula stevensoni]|uniref:Uncharacterized protein n=1 Tax=Darwinula stevensoni TaxID=69355 RepID=A0A7R8XB28_9CRUS|nr:unnamed protein product [Darwinula stevensoni]CAG0887302.1 unnamed protein product [Darwinula stevensoni]
MYVSKSREYKSSPPLQHVPDEIEPKTETEKEYSRSKERDMSKEASAKKRGRYGDEGSEGMEVRKLLTRNVRDTEDVHTLRCQCNQVHAKFLLHRRLSKDTRTSLLSWILGFHVSSIALSTLMGFSVYAHFQLTHDIFHRDITSISVAILLFCIFHLFYHVLGSTLCWQIRFPRTESLSELEETVFHEGCIVKLQTHFFRCLLLFLLFAVLAFLLDVTILFLMRLVETSLQLALRFEDPMMDATGYLFRCPPFSRLYCPCLPVCEECFPNLTREEERISLMALVEPDATETEEEEFNQKGIAP